MTFTHLWG